MLSVQADIDLIDITTNTMNDNSDRKSAGFEKELSDLKVYLKDLETKFSEVGSRASCAVCGAQFRKRR
eukprot:7828601-Pyramimonas_sp.AAC.1